MKYRNNSILSINNLRDIVSYVNKAKNILKQIPKTKSFDINDLLTCPNLKTKVELRTEFIEYIKPKLSNIKTLNKALHYYLHKVDSKPINLRH